MSRALLLSNRGKRKWVEAQATHLYFFSLSVGLCAGCKTTLGVWRHEVLHCSYSILTSISIASLNHEIRSSSESRYTRNDVTWQTDRRNVGHHPCSSVCKLGAASWSHCRSTWMSRTLILNQGYRVKFALRHGVDFPYKVAS